MSKTSATFSSAIDRQTTTERTDLLSRYHRIRAQTEALCQPLATEDYCIQSMPDVSPPKWHLGHTTWFFETFLLSLYEQDYRPYHPGYDYLFNSYYETVGTPYPRSRRGLLSRPTVEEIYNYRAHTDAAMTRLIENETPEWNEIAKRVLLGLQHEQQHQELLLTDIKHIYAINPLQLAYALVAPVESSNAPELSWIKYSGDLISIGHSGEGFAFDNELPKHRVYLDDYVLASRPVSNGEYLAFIQNGGYECPEYWLSDGWRIVNEQAWRAPLYWQQHGGQWWSMTLNGLLPINLQEPVCHVSYYEADAYARFAGSRLPSEAEWERAACEIPVSGNFMESGRLHPAPTDDTIDSAQFYGDVWEWTCSNYAPYPGYRTLPGALGEYNGKFMCNQMVLRGGSCVTPQSHVRPSYRNFFPPESRWQFSGIRLASGL